MTKMSMTEMNNLEDAPTETFKDLVNHAAKVAHVSSVFGEAREVGDKTLIPVARVGFAVFSRPGQGIASTFSETTHDSVGEATRPKGARGGSRVLARATPVAII